MKAGYNKQTNKQQQQNLLESWKVALIQEFISKLFFRFI